MLPSNLQGPFSLPGNLLLLPFQNPFPRFSASNSYFPRGNTPPWGAWRSCQLNTKGAGIRSKLGQSDALSWKLESGDQTQWFLSRVGLAGERLPSARSPHVPWNLPYLFIFIYFKIWNASRICLSFICKGHANLCTVVILYMYVLPKRALPFWGLIVFPFSLPI